MASVNTWVIGTQDVSAPQILIKQTGETRKFIMDFANILATSESLSGTPTIDIVPTGSNTVTTSGITLVGNTVEAFYLGGVDLLRYRVNITTLSSDGNQIFVRDGVLLIGNA